MKKKTFISSLLALTLASSLLMPSTLTYGQKHIDVKVPTPNALAEKEELRHKINERENLSIQDVGIMRASQIVRESITIEADKYVAESGEYINFSISVDTGGESVSFAYLTLRTSVGERTYKEYVILDYSDENLFVGDLRVSDGTNSGMYSVDSIEFMDELDYNTYVEVDKIYNSEFYEEDEYPTIPLPTDLVEITGTRGEVIPELNIQSSKSTYKADEVIVFTVEAIAEDVEYDSGSIYLENVINDVPFEVYMDLEKNSSGQLIGSFDVGKYTPPGEYIIDSMSLYDYSYDHYISFRNEKNIEDGEEYLYSDFDDFTIEIVDTILDVTEPEIISCTIDKTELVYGESLTVEVEAADYESGIYDLSIWLESENDFQSAMLTYVGDNKYKGSVVFAIDDELSEEYQVNIYAVDELFNINEKQYGVVKLSGNQNIRTISGSNRFNTAIEIGRHVESYGMAIVASGESFPDALAAGPLANIYNAPIYLAQKNRISQSTLNEMKENMVHHVTILGGESAVSSEVERTLVDAGMSVDRIAGVNRFDTAIRIAEDLYFMSESEDSRVVLANGMNYPDALSIGSYASINGLPILLTKGDALHKGVKEFLDFRDVKNVDIVGGESVVSESIVAELEQMGIQVTRYAGADRYSTSVVVAEKLFDSSDKIVVANGMNFADALAAVPLAAQKNMPIILVRPDRLPKTIETYVKDNKDRLTRIVPVGGEAAVSSKVKEALGNLLQ